MMPMKDVAKFVFKTLEYAEDGDIIIPKMKTVKIKDLADVISNQQTITSPDVGEKIDELMIDEQESVHVKEYDDRYVLKINYRGNNKPFEYTSANAPAFTKEEIKKMVENFVKEYK